MASTNQYSGHGNAIPAETSVYKKIDNDRNLKMLTKQYKITLHINNAISINGNHA